MSLHFKLYKIATERVMRKMERDILISKIHTTYFIKTF